MNIEVVRKLVDRGIIHENTEITANYLGKDIAGTKTAQCRGNFFIKGVRIASESGTVFFDAVSTVDGTTHVIQSPQVEGIDGMALDTLASVYGINATGGKLIEGKRRGRKPKAKMEA